MTDGTRMIRFEVQVGRIIELLAAQIYQSPLALLRENAQNAFDAVLMRRTLGAEFHPRIDITLSREQIVVADNGIGMTPAELVANFWRAGASGKNTDEARAAGVVGTFGIGAMANFGIADSLVVETESARERVRTRSFVDRENLSTTVGCISVEDLTPDGIPGTVVTARLESGADLDVAGARDYIAQFVEFLDVDVYVNSDLVSRRTMTDALPSDRANWTEKVGSVDLDGLATADVEVRGLADGQMRILLENVVTAPPSGPPGRAALVQARSAIRTLRSGFGLATVSTGSEYAWGGVVDLPALQPTAGREALESTSQELLRLLLGAVDGFASNVAMGHETSLENQAFLNWVVRHGRFDICGPMPVRVEPQAGERPLSSLPTGVQYYAGSDNSIVQAYASEDQPLVVLSRRAPRRDCEIGYLRSLDAVEVSDQPRVLEDVRSSVLSVAHGALQTRIAVLLLEDYFIAANVQYAKMSHGVPLLVDEATSPLTIHIDPESSTVAPLIQLYESDFSAFGPFVKDFIRAQLFPRLAQLVPSSTRDGAEAFLRRLRDRRELFEVDWTDRLDLEAAWEQFKLGEMTLSEFNVVSTSISSRSVVVVEPGQAAELSSVVPGIEDSQPEQDGDEFGPLPPVDRREAVTDALVLAGDRALNGYSCFLAISDRARRQYGDFFLQPHTTSVVWGGQRVLFVFLHHSRRFGLYYDVQCQQLVEATSGGGPIRSSTLLLQDRVFLPVPSEVAANFIPRERERIRFEVRADVFNQDDLKGEPDR